MVFLLLLVPVLWLWLPLWWAFEDTLYPSRESGCMGFVRACVVIFGLRREERETPHREWRVGGWQEKMACVELVMICTWYL